MARVAVSRRIQYTRKNGVKIVEGPWRLSWVPSQDGRAAWEVTCRASLGGSVERHRWIRAGRELLRKHFLRQGPGLFWLVLDRFQKIDEGDERAHLNALAEKLRDLKRKERKNHA